MKIVVYSYRDDEIDFIKQFEKKYHVTIDMYREALTEETVIYAKDADCVSIMTTKTDRSIIQQLHDFGVIYISTRTIGYDHIDIDACKEYGIHVGNVSYSLSSVAEYTVMMILMSLRNMKLILERFQTQDFSLQNIRGHELRDKTVGIIGTGKIGQEVIKLLAGFDCQILAYDIYPNEDMKEYCSYHPLEYIYENSDIISLHIPSFEDTYHMINYDSLCKMKNSVIIINTARGALIDTRDLIQGLEDKQIGYVALDVVEEESLLYYKDLKNEVLSNRDLNMLRSFPNVMLTPHTAFFTSQAVSDMVEYSIISCKNEIEGKNNQYRIV
ncbi:MAG: D-isomer specific 2-hydroxyacid dehydrogenase family protein [Coprobacillaceae bacterium]